MLNIVMQNLSDKCKGNILKFRVELREVEKMCIFQPITGRISEMVRDGAKVAIEH